METLRVSDGLCQQKNDDDDEEKNCELRVACCVSSPVSFAKREYQHYTASNSLIHEKKKTFVKKNKMSEKK